MSGGPFLYPNVTSVPNQNGIERSSEDARLKRQSGAPTEFDQALDRVLDKKELNPSVVGGARDLSQVKQPLKFSAHASQRLNDRKIALSPNMLAKVSDAVDKAEAKGIEDTLVLTPDAALIVSVKNRTVITAIDKNSLNGNVFSNIDGAVIV